MTSSDFKFAYDSYTFYIYIYLNAAYMGVFAGLSTSRAQCGLRLVKAFLLAPSSHTAEDSKWSSSPKP